METKDIQIQLDEINSKLKIILDEIEFQRKHRQEMEDLKADLMRVSKDLYKTALDEFEQVSDYLNTDDLLHLLKKLLRNINNLNKLFEQLENIRDFIKDFAPISRELSTDLMNKLDELDRKNYFPFLKEIFKVIDNIFTSFTVEDVHALGDNIVTILTTVKNLTQPDILQSVNNALNVYKKLDIKVEDNVSLIRILKQLNQPETKKAMLFALQFLQSLSEINQNGNTNYLTKKE
jgi:uncharacterized protein YjgD (DUF1641 family)